MGTILKESRPIAETAESSPATTRISNRLRPKTGLLIFVITVFGPVGNILLSKGMKSVGPVTSFAPAQLSVTGEHILASGFIWLGIASLLTFFVAYMLVLTWADYSYVQPAASSAYLMVALLAHFALGEVITPLRWTGIAVICLGVLIVGRTTPRSTEGT
jgi:drug/metabolite transporter (DMT)-like permease